MIKLIIIVTIWGELILGKFCSNCGNELNPNADVCLSCGQMVANNKTTNNNGKALATLSVVFGSLGFYPLIFIGSIVGLITSLIGINDDNNQFKGRSKIGLGLSIGSLCVWILIIIIVAATEY
mgnify:CR=1 FL=1